MNKNNIECFCCSGKKYSDCCQKFHLGGVPSSIVELMRSRYSAYAIGLVDYILKTSYQLPKSMRKLEAMRKEIMNFSNFTVFQGLEIIDFNQSEDSGWVIFHAILKQNDKDASFKEKSYFIKLDGRWLYTHGDIF